VQGIADTTSRADRLSRKAKLNRLYLNIIVVMFNYPYKLTQYKCGIISGLAVMGICKDGGWESPKNYTPIYSAVIKVAWVLVVYQSVLKREDDI